VDSICAIGKTELVRVCTRDLSWLKEGEGLESTSVIPMLYFNISNLDLEILKHRSFCCIQLVN